MRSSARRLTAALTCTLALAACGSQPSGSVASDDDRGAAERTTQQATTSEPATAIADDFPLSAGMAGPEDVIPTSRSGTGLRDLELCGTSPLRGLGTRDRMVADNSGGEALDTRELVVLGSSDEAADLAQSLSDLPTRCDATPLVDGWSLTTEVRSSPLGDAPSAVLVQRYLQDGEPVPGARVVHVVQVGAALLVTWTYGEWPDLTDGIDQTAALLAEVVTAMAVYADGGEPAGPDPASASASATASPAVPSKIPDDFPLLDGWPDSSEADGSGRSGPARSARTMGFTACDETWSDPAYVDLLRAEWDSAEDYRVRQLATYADADAAVAAIEGLVAFERACPSEPPGEDGFGETTEVRPVALGGEAWAMLERATFEGSPTIYGESVLVVRVGLSVLTVRHSGHAGFPAGDGQEQIDAMAAEAATPVAEMCVFTRTGC